MWTTDRWNEEEKEILRGLEDNIVIFPIGIISPIKYNPVDELNLVIKKTMMFRISFKDQTLESDPLEHMHMVLNNSIYLPAVLGVMYDVRCMSLSTTTRYVDIDSSGRIYGIIIVRQDFVPTLDPLKTTSSEILTTRFMAGDGSCRLIYTRENATVPSLSTHHFSCILMNHDDFDNDGDFLPPSIDTIIDEYGDVPGGYTLLITNILKNVVDRTVSEQRIFNITKYFGAYGEERERILNTIDPSQYLSKSIDLLYNAYPMVSYDFAFDDSPATICCTLRPIIDMVYIMPVLKFSKDEVIVGVTPHPDVLLHLGAIIDEVSMSTPLIGSELFIRAAISIGISSFYSTPEYFRFIGKFGTYDAGNINGENYIGYIPTMTYGIVTKSSTIPIVVNDSKVQILPSDFHLFTDGVSAWIGFYLLEDTVEMYTMDGEVKDIRGIFAVPLELTVTKQTLSGEEVIKLYDKIDVDKQAQNQLTLMIRTRDKMNKYAKAFDPKLELLGIYNNTMYFALAQIKPPRLRWKRSINRNKMNRFRNVGEAMFVITKVDQKKEMET